MRAVSQSIRTRRPSVRMKLPACGLPWVRTKVSGRVRAASARASWWDSRWRSSGACRVMSLPAGSAKGPSAGSGTSPAMVASSVPRWGIAKCSMSAEPQAERDGVEFGDDRPGLCAHVRVHVVPGLPGEALAVQMCVDRDGETRSEFGDHGAVGRRHRRDGEGVAPVAGGCAGLKGRCSDPAAESRRPRERAGGCPRSRTSVRLRCPGPTSGVIRSRPVRTPGLLPAPSSCSPRAHTNPLRKTAQEGSTWLKVMEWPCRLTAFTRRRTTKGATRVSMGGGMGSPGMMMMRGARGRNDREILDHKLAPGTIRRIMKIARPYKVLIGLFLAITVVDAVLGVMPPLLSQRSSTTASSSTTAAWSWPWPWSWPVSRCSTPRSASSRATCRRASARA